MYFFLPFLTLYNFPPHSQFAYFIFFLSSRIIQKRLKKNHIFPSRIHHLHKRFMLVFIRKFFPEMSNVLYSSFREIDTLCILSVQVMCFCCVHTCQYANVLFLLVWKLYIFLHTETGVNISKVSEFPCVRVTVFIHVPYQYVCNESTRGSVANVVLSSVLLLCKLSVKCGICIKMCAAKQRPFN